MKKLVVDANLQQQLDPTYGQCEICDQQGRTVGIFLSPDLYRLLLNAWIGDTQSEEEDKKARRAASEDWKKNGGGMTTTQAIEFLKSLDRSTGTSPT